VSLDDLYKEIILDHTREPRNKGELPDPDVAARGHNPLCGDEILLSLKFGADGDTIHEIAFGGRGCSISQASASMMTVGAKGARLDAVDSLGRNFKALMTGTGSAEGLSGNDDLEALQGVKRFPVRIKCALLPWTALDEAIETWRRASRPAESRPPSASGERSAAVS
jgi:nitrogen fixation protein NifU and related proteins